MHNSSKRRFVALGDARESEASFHHQTYI